MTKTFRLTLAAALMTAVGAVSANTLSFDAVAGSPFTNAVEVTPTADNSLFILVNGGIGQFSALSFEINGGPILLPLAGRQNLAISFSDTANKSYLLSANQTYTLTVTGTVAPSFAGKTASYSIFSRNGSIALPAVSPVPEPETYALLLAGLGLVGAAARRRRTSTV